MKLSSLPVKLFNRQRGLDGIPASQKEFIKGVIVSYRDVCIEGYKDGLINFSSIYDLECRLISSMFAGCKI